MKWASWTNFVLGVWLIFAPFTLLYAKVQTAMYEDVLLGLVIGSLALSRAVGPETEAMTQVSWYVATAGLWVLIAPFVLGYAGTTAAVFNDVSVGLVVAILAFWRGLAEGPQDMPHHMAPHH
jgi:hypothetical protein